tara:strand:+ start:579 stop:722 length:144 start_codon:yes stop_codon:yes gene_type:complete
MEKNPIFVEETSNGASRIHDRIRPGFSAEKLAKSIERWHLKRRGFAK